MSDVPEALLLSPLPVHPGAKGEQNGGGPTTSQAGRGLRPDAPEWPPKASEAGEWACCKKVLCCVSHWTGS